MPLSSAFPKKTRRNYLTISGHRTQYWGKTYLTGRIINLIHHRTFHAPFMLVLIVNVFQNKT